MKKIIALTLALIMCFSIASVAMADVENTFFWDDVVDAIEADGYEGDLCYVADLPLIVWVPDFMDAVELTESDIEANFICRFATDDDSFSLGVTCNETLLSYEEALELLAAAADVEDYGEAVINDLPVLIYTYINDNGDTRYAVSMFTEDDYVIEFLFDMEDLDYSELAEYMAVSIQYYEE